MQKHKIELIKNKISELALVSTSHGLPSAFRTERTFLKIFWLFLFVLGCGGGVLFVSKSMIDYFDYPVVTNICDTYETPIQYPQISFINMKYPKLNISLEKTLVYCFFNLETCNSSDFEIIKDDLGFVSYKFKKNETLYIGLLYGLQLGLDFGNLSQYENQSTGNMGMRFVIHNKTETSGLYGGFSDKGINVDFNENTDIAIRRINSQKLGYPYNNCIKDKSLIDSFNSSLYDYILNATNFSYTQQYCLDLCKGREIYKYFKIQNKINSFTYSYFDLMNLNVSKQNLYNFVTKEIVNRTKKLCYIECPLECDSVDYQYSISSNKIEFEQSLTYYESIGFISCPLYKRSNYSLNDFFTVKIYYDKASYTSITEMSKIDTSDLIANIGGNFGLFIGMSFLSFAEIFEVLIEIILIILQKNNIVRNGWF